MRASCARSKPAIQEPRSLSSVLLPLTKAPASMAERGAALQTHNNELVSCEQPSEARILKLWSHSPSPLKDLVILFHSETYCRHRGPEVQKGRTPLPGKTIGYYMEVMSV